MAERVSIKEEVAGTDPRSGASIHPADSGASEFSSREAFDEVLRLHRCRATAEEVHFLQHLCFSLDETVDPAGLRYVLWQPVALFLQCGFQIEIEELMCNGQVVLAYIGHDAAAFTEKIIPRIEAVRREYPLWVVSSGPQVLLHVLANVAESLRSHDRSAAEQVQRMLVEYKNAIRRGDYSGLPALRAQLSELGAVSTESDLRSCVQFLRTAHEGMHGWPLSSAALASEAVLARDWMTPEEDAAWSHL